MSTSRPELRDLALTLHDLAVRVTRYTPAQLGLDPLPASELLVLRTIQEHPGSNVSEVAAATAMQPSNVSAALRALTVRGLLDKKAHPDDRRVTMLYPSKQAVTNKNAIEQAISASVSAGLRELSAEQRAALIAAMPAMRELTARMTTASAKPGRAAPSTKSNRATHAG